MTTAHVFIATSLDGFIARPDHSLDWLASAAPEDEDHGYDAFIAKIDGIVMGRATFQAVLGFTPWPYDRPVRVISRSLTPDAVPQALRASVRILSGRPADVLATVAAEGWRRAYVDGGRLIQSFLADGLIDDLTLTRVPILIGAGRPLFGALPRDIPLIHETTRTFASGLVQSRYRVAA
ncbi:MAG: dihydrofolate reductase family protein [Pseudomonadota bacterium]